VPTQKIEYLGFILSSADMTVKLTEKKVNAILKRCREFLRENKEHLIRQVASLIGTLISPFPGVQCGVLYFRSLEHDKMRALKRIVGDFEAKMVLSPERLEELSWWVANVDSCSCAKNLTLSLKLTHPKRVGCETGRDENPGGLAQEPKGSAY